MLSGICRVVCSWKWCCFVLILMRSWWWLVILVDGLFIVILGVFVVRGWKLVICSCWGFGLIWCWFIFGLM